jgi:hypothetical protein
VEAVSKWQCEVTNYIVSLDIFKESTLVRRFATEIVLVRLAGVMIREVLGSIFSLNFFGE